MLKLLIFLCFLNACIAVIEKDVGEVCGWIVALLANIRIEMMLRESAQAVNKEE